MLTKLSINGIAFTETQNGVTTSFKVDSITFEENCTAEEAIKVLEAAVNVFKTVRPRNKRRNTKPAKKRYNVEKYQIDGMWECQKYHYYYLVFDNVSADYYIKFFFENGDVLTRKLDTTKALTVYGSKNKEKYIVNKYSCNNFTF